MKLKVCIGPLVRKELGWFNVSIYCNEKGLQEEIIQFLSQYVKGGRKLEFTPAKGGYSAIQVVAGSQHEAESIQTSLRGIEQEYCRLAKQSKLGAIEGVCQRVYLAQRYGL